MKCTSFTLSTVIISLMCLSMKVCVNGEEEASGNEVPAAKPDLLKTTLPDVTHDKEVICQASRQKDEDIKVDVSDTMSYDDMLKLIVWNSKYDLKAGTHFFQFPAAVNWKRDVLKSIVAVFLKSCPPQLIPPSFINIAKELFMIYQNSLNDTEDHSEAWKPFITILDKCLKTSEPFTPASAGFQMTGIQVPTASGGTELIGLLPPAELADESPDIDIIIDTMWWIFSFSFGNCYWTATTPSIWASRYKRLFYTDFLRGLRERWLHAGLMVDFGVIFGDFDVDTIVKNIRLSVTAGYTRSGIPDRQLVRSVILSHPSLGIEAGLNKKVGSALE